MQKTKTKIITLLLLTAMALAIFPLAVNASTGFILINANIPGPSPATTTVPAGGNINLNFGSVTFSGGQFYLLLSADGFSQVSAGDIRFTPAFSLATLQTVGTTTVTDPTGIFPGTWTIGSDGLGNSWVNGTIPANIAGGPYFIKCFDGAVTSLAVTDKAFTVTASISVAPTSGAAGTSITVSGNAFPASALVNVTYLNAFTNPASTVTVSNLTQTGSIGNFSITMPAPDLKQAAATGDNAAVSNQVVFTVQDNKTGTTYTAIYNEHQRGLLQIGRPKVGAITGNVQNATNIYGNLTNFAASISVGVGDSLRIAGNWFYPGAMSIRWDNSVDITPSGLAANGTGFFNTTVTVPTTGNGVHNVTIVDNNLVVFVVFLNVVQSITIAPTTGAIGTMVTVNGFGFPSLNTPANTVYNATITFGASATPIAWALTDANGAFTTTFLVPTAPGGSNTVTAATNDSLITSASKTFLVTANFTVNPTAFYANDSTTQVKASGTGFDPTKTFFVAIDNVFSPFTNTTNGIAPSSSGILNFTFIGVGFQAGLHIVVLYQAGSGSGTNAPVANATFMVLADPTTSTTGLLTAINTTVNSNQATLATMNTTLNNISATLIGVNGTVALISTNQGLMTVNLAAIGANITSIKGTEATIQTSLGTIQTTLTAINATVIAINGNVATLSTSIGTVNTNIAAVQSSVSGLSSSMSSVTSSVSGISGTITSISSGVATIQTTLGTVNTKLDSINAVIGAIAGQNVDINTTLGTITTTLASIGTTVTRIDGNVATIQTNLGTLTGTVTSISNGVATIQTTLGTMQTNIGNLQADETTTKDNTASLSPLIIVAIVLALVAAIAAIASIVLMRRKIAG